MLNIFNDLEPFFKDNYDRLGVREYAKLRKISPPTASTRLKKYHKEGLLRQEEERKYLLFSANPLNKTFIELSRAYHREYFERIGLTNALQKELINPLIIIFGSFAKAEINENSDVDIAIFSPSRKKPDLSDFEKKLGRTMQVFVFKNKKQVNEDLLNSILNGFIISGEWHY